MQKSIEEIVNETLAYYEEDPSRRAVEQSTGKCRYITQDGRMCAVGRCFTEEAHPETLTGHAACIIRTGAGAECGKQVTDLDTLLKSEYRGHPRRFWRELQFLHDRPAWWDSSTTPEARRSEADSIIKNYSAPIN